MDRDLDPRDIRTRQRRRLLLTVVVLVVAAIAGSILKSWIRPSVRSSRIQTAVVDRGMVEAATLCSGTVVPATEQVIPSPFSSRVVEVYEEPGATVAAGQPLLTLDDDDVASQIARLEDEIDLLENHRLELQLELEATLEELEGQLEIKQERLVFLETKTAQQRALRDLGLATIHELHQAELDERIAGIELRQLGEAAQRARSSTANRIEGIDIERSLLLRNLQEQKAKLSSATVRADRGGVLTWITPEVGATIAGGTEVARVADLSRFQVEASASDLHVSRFAVGSAVRVVVDGRTLTGHISSIPPAIDHGIMTLKIDLDEPDHPALRANRRVDVHVITATRSDTLRITKGPFCNGPGEQEVFVIRDGEARRARATIGVAGIDHYELLAGLGEGDTVIISNMEDYLHLERIRVR